MNKIALGLYSVRDLYRTDFAACLRKTAAIGYTGVECFGPPVLEAEQVRTLLDANKLTLVGWHLPIETLEGEAFAKTLAYVRAIQCPRVVVPWMPPELFKSAEETLAFAKRLDAVAQAFVPYGISVGYHNHDVEMVAFADGSLPWAVLMENSRIFGQLDCGNAMASKNPAVDVVELVSRWPGRAETVHLKPYSKEKEHQTMIGEDDIPWIPFMQACKKIGNTDWFIVEYEEDMLYEQFEGAELCLRALQRMI